MCVLIKLPVNKDHTGPLSKPSQIQENESVVQVDVGGCFLRLLRKHLWFIQTDTKDWLAVVFPRKNVISKQHTHFKRKMSTKVQTSAASQGTALKGAGTNGADTNRAIYITSNREAGKRLQENKA